MSRSRSRSRDCIFLSKGGGDGRGATWHDVCEALLAHRARLSLSLLVLLLLHSAGVWKDYDKSTVSSSERGLHRNLTCIVASAQIQNGR